MRLLIQASCKILLADSSIPILFIRCVGSSVVFRFQFRFQPIALSLLFFGPFESICSPLFIDRGASSTYVGSHDVEIRTDVTNRVQDLAIGRVIIFRFHAVYKSDEFAIMWVSEKG